MVGRPPIGGYTDDDTARLDGEPGGVVIGVPADGWPTGHHSTVDPAPDDPPVSR